jgi:hypothetical protein
VSKPKIVGIRTSFSEKKEAKKLLVLGRGGVATTVPRSKSFLLLFLKKKTFLTSST